MPLCGTSEFALAGNRIRDKGLEDPHFTTKLLAHVALLGIEPRSPDSAEVQSPMSLPLDDRAIFTDTGIRTRVKGVKDPYHKPLDYIGVYPERDLNPRSPA